MGNLFNWVQYQLIRNIEITGYSVFTIILIYDYNSIFLRMACFNNIFISTRFKFNYIYDIFEKQFPSPNV